MTNGTRTMQRNYDLAGDTIFQDSGTGQTYTYTPNSVGQVYSVSTTQNGSTNTLSASALYTAWGALSARNGIETWGYDKRLRLTSHVTVHGATTEFSQSLTYQPNGNLKSSTEIAGTHSSSWSYTYDDLNRLSTALSSGLTPSEGCQETYDNWGNRTAQAGASGGYVCTSVSPTANTNNQLSTLAYDAAGNATYDGTNTYTYDAEGRITAVTAGGSPVAAYTYGPDGQRATKTVGSTTTYYSNDFDGALIARYESGTGITGVVPYNQEVWLNGQHLGTVPGVTNAFSRASVDQIGSERVELDPSGNIYGSMYYLPFGEGPQVIQGTPKTTTLFTGKELDTETNNDYFGARYYRPVTGRFLSPDWAPVPMPVPFGSLANPQSLNMYAYLLNNPLSGTDEDGHDGPDDWLEKNAPEVYKAEQEVEASWSGTVGRFQYDKKQAAKALDNFNTYLGFGSTNCAGGGSCTDALGQAVGAGIAFVEFGGASEDAVAEKQIGIAAEKIENLINDHLTGEDLEAAYREASGGLRVAGPGGKLFSHVEEVSQAIRGLDRQATHLERVLSRSGLSDSHAQRINGLIEKARGTIDAGQKAISRQIPE